AKWQKRDDSLSLKGNEAAALDANYFEGLSPKFAGSTISLKVNDLSEDITFTKLKKFNVLNLRTAGITVVVSDELFSKLASGTNLVNMEVYELTNEDDAKTLSKQIQSLL